MKQRSVRVILTFFPLFLLGTFLLAAQPETPLVFSLELLLNGSSTYIPGSLSSKNDANPKNRMFPNYPTGETLHCDITLEIYFVGGTSSVEPSKRLSVSCRLPPPGLGLNGIPMAIEELRRARALLWEEAKKIIYEYEKKPKVDWVRLKKVEYQTNKTEPIFTTSFIRTNISGAPGHTSIPSDF
ncbi:MAG TPA: hypothetical protein PLU72_12495 [Candidatus Ozemobacteraceae bacterium]|nr:MAG: hypothetical protein BWY66_00028 [bacterium ADurb.Bin374]HOT28997.1 hypothetical protein [Candidatus Ozemobacteraceae bacterium]